MVTGVVLKSARIATFRISWYFTRASCRRADTWEISRQGKTGPHGWHPTLQRGQRNGTNTK